MRLSECSLYVGACSYGAKCHRDLSNFSVTSSFSVGLFDLSYIK